MPSFDWANYGDLANQLATQARDSETLVQMSEACARSAISRSYYVLYHAGRDLYRSLTGSSRKRVGHQELWLDLCGRSEYARYKAVAERAWAYREQADYEAEMTDPQQRRRTVVQVTDIMSAHLKESQYVAQALLNAESGILP